MKFVLRSISQCSGRLGCIRDVERLPGCVLETPLLLMYTKGGSVPHLTYEVLLKITQEPLSVQLPLPNIMHCEEAVAEFKKGVAQFIGLGNSLTYCTVQDPATSTPQGFNVKDAISVFARSGNTKVTPEKYMDIMEAFCPDMYQVLCDGNTNLESSKKRIEKAVDRSSLFLEKCIERHRKSKVLYNSAIVGVIEGGYNVVARESCAQQVAQSPVSGFVIDGLHNNGPSVEALPFEKVKPIIEASMKYLPEDKFRIVHGSWNPEAVLDMVKLGVDMFDSSYPFLVAERGGALVFCNHLDLKSDQKTISMKSIEADNIHGGIEDPRILLQQAKETDKVISRKYEISLKDRRYFEDLDPISKFCTCLTCKNHKRAYIHHLLNTKELLASVLLMIHNMHHYLQFFQTIRCALKENTLNHLRTSLSKGVQMK